MGCTGSNGAVAVSSDGSDDDPLRLQAEPMIMHAGLTDDPFFFDLTDFLTVYGSTDPSVLLDATGADQCFNFVYFDVKSWINDFPFTFP